MYTLYREEFDEKLSFDEASSAICTSLMCTSYNTGLNKRYTSEVRRGKETFSKLIFDVMSFGALKCRAMFNELLEFHTIFARVFQIRNA